MAFELIYTSVPQGIKSGSSGFCTVAYTQGLAANIALKLEGMSAYKPYFPHYDENAKRNPVSFCHYSAVISGEMLHFISRVSFYGLDYTKRSNKLAHHLVLRGSEVAQLTAGPAAVSAQNGLFVTEWDQPPQLLRQQKEIPCPGGLSGKAALWESVTGDAGWAGTLVQHYLDNAGTKTAYIIFDPLRHTDVLRLVNEALMLLPENKRWEVAYSTYFMALPAGMNCHWRFCTPDSEALKEAKRLPGNLIIDLTQPLSRAGNGVLEEQARTGIRKSQPGGIGSADIHQKNARPPAKTQSYIGNNAFGNRPGFYPGTGLVPGAGKSSRNTLLIGVIAVAVLLILGIAGLIVFVINGQGAAPDSNQKPKTEATSNAQATGLKVDAPGQTSPQATAETSQPTVNREVVRKKAEKAKSAAEKALKAAENAKEKAAALTQTKEAKDAANAADAARKQEEEANNALNQANKAKSAADAALTLANTAKNEAGQIKEALEIAEKAVNTATDAVNKATDAVNKATDAVAAAEQAAQEAADQEAAAQEAAARNVVDKNRRGLFASALEVNSMLNRKNGIWVFEGILNPGDKLKSVEIRYTGSGNGHTKVSKKAIFKVDKDKITGPREMDDDFKEKAPFVFDVQYAGCDLTLKEANADFTSGSKPQILSLTITGKDGKDTVIPMSFVEKDSIWPDNKTDGRAALRGIRFKTTGEIILEYNSTELDVVAKLDEHFSASVVSVNGLKFVLAPPGRQKEGNVYTYLYLDPNVKAAIEAKTELGELRNILISTTKKIKKDGLNDFEDALREAFGKGGDKKKVGELCGSVPLDKLKEKLLGKEDLKKYDEIKSILQKYEKWFGESKSIQKLIEAQGAVITKRHKAIEAKLARQTPAEMRLKNGKVLKRITAQPCQW